MASTTYTVRSGDTLSRIALHRYGDAQLYKQLAIHNSIANPDSIVPGQVILVPAKLDLLKSKPPVSQVEYSLHVRRYAPFRSFGGGFEGDGRGFSTSLKATFRTAGIATFGPKSNVNGTGQSSGSSWIGVYEFRKSISLGSIGQSIGDVHVTISKIDSSPGKLSFTIYTEGNLPLKDLLFHQSIASRIDKLNKRVRPNSRRPQGSPDIDTFVDFSAVFSNGRVEFKGTVRGDGFPNAEIFVTDSLGNAVPLFDYRTKSGATGPLHRLFGAHEDYVLGSFTRGADVQGDGTFKSTNGLVPEVVHEV